MNEPEMIDDFIRQFSTTSDGTPAMTDNFWLILFLSLFLSRIFFTIAGELMEIMRSEIVLKKIFYRPGSNLI